METISAVAAKNIQWATQSCTLGYDVLGNAKVVRYSKIVKESMLNTAVIVLKFIVLFLDLTYTEAHFPCQNVHAHNMGPIWVLCWFQVGL